MDDGEPGIPLAPMIDIVFLLLIFFITTSVFARLESEISITVPAAETATPAQRQMGELIVNLRQDGGIVVNQREVGANQLGVLLSRISQRFPDQSVIIRGDRRVNLERAIEILDICAKSGVWNVSFAALPPEPAGDAEEAGEN